MGGSAEVPWTSALVAIEKPDSVNIILGQTHFIKSVEDLHEALVGSVPGIKFGLAFCEASGPALLRISGTSEAMIDLAQEKRSRHRGGPRLSDLHGKRLPDQRT